MITIYRIIKFEFTNEETMAEQMLSSIEPGIYQLPCGSRITIRDRRDDPCERNFLSEPPDPRIRRSLLSKSQYQKLTQDQKDQLYT